MTWKSCLTIRICLSAITFIGALFFLAGCGLSLKGSADVEVDGDVTGDPHAERVDGPDADVVPDGEEDVEPDSPCPDGETLCGTECVDLESDFNNCGECGNACEDGEVCSNGDCAEECDEGLTNCDGDCVDTSSDPDHCGVCNNTCPTPANSEAVCVERACDYECLPGWRDENGFPEDGCEERECTEEVCNGFDDDCDDDIDETFDCIQGSEVECTTDCGSTGTGACSDTCELPDAEACDPPDETCNGEDDDCDGVCDNGFDCCADADGLDCDTGCGSTGTGTCSSACELETCEAPAEICNGMDDDCNDGCDEDWDCCAGEVLDCATSCGTEGTRTCSLSCELFGCVPPEETCNGIDDDCDTVCDNGFGCCAGSMTSPCTTSCGSTGTGACSSACALESCAPPAEICNGEDDDCNDGCDEDWDCCVGETGACDTSCGTTGTATCTSGCGWGACDSPGETCNGADDDCDTVCDNGFDCCAGSTGFACTTTCGSTGTGACSSACALESCAPPAEICNGADDDCNDGCDEDWDCCAGTARACTVGACSGTEACANSCDWSGDCDLGAPPDNDTCETATVVTAGEIHGTTCAAADDYNLGCVEGNRRSPEVVYRLELERRSFVEVDTCSDTAWDTVIYLETTCPYNMVRCNDDHADCGDQSKIERTAIGPGTFYIVVSGANENEFGPFTLNLSVTPTGDPPGNDECTGAVDITGGGTFTGNTTTATNDGDLACAGYSRAGVWYRFTLAQEEVVYLDLQDGPNWDTVLTVLSGSCTGSEALCNDDACGSGNYRSQVTGVLAAGTYYVLVSGFYTVSYGDYSLRFVSSPCPGAFRLQGSNTGNTEGDGNDTSGSCGSGDSPDRPWYFAHCPGSRSATMTLCDDGQTWDSVMYIRTGNGGLCGSTEVACNDNGCGGGGDWRRSSISTTLTGPGLFFTIVDGIDGDEGRYTLTASY